MNSVHDISLREKFSRIGRKLGWFDKPLIAKIESVSMVCRPCTIIFKGACISEALVTIIFP